MAEFQAMLGFPPAAEAKRARKARSRPGQEIVDLMAALENVYALLRRDNIVTVEIGAPLLEFGEILNRL
jgi:hypothetical protein